MGASVLWLFIGGVELVANDPDDSCDGDDLIAARVVICCS